MNLLLLPLLFLFAVPQDPPKKKGLAKGAIALGDKGQGRSKRIPGGSEHEFRGVSFDLPKGWTFTASDDGAEIAPKGANQKGQVEEKYTLIHDGDLHALDGDEIKESVQELADAVQDGLKAQKPE